MIQAIRDRKLTAVASWELAEELAAVLRRPKLRRYRIADADVRATLALLATFLPTVEFDIDVRDPKDVPVIRAALNGSAEAIITGDKDLLDDPELRRSLGDRGIRVMTPRALGELLD